MLTGTPKKRILLLILVLLSVSYFSACSILTAPYYVGKGIVKGAYILTKTVTKTAYGTVKIVYKVGGFTFSVVMAPLTWPFTRHGLESIDDLDPRDAIRQGRVKNSPYVVDGKKYVPISLKEASDYYETGIASWYGSESCSGKDGCMTADGEAFDPEGLSAAHKYLPLPCFVRVTNLENKKSIIIRVNDRGPFVKGRIIDLSAGGAKKLGYYKKGTAKVFIEAIEIKEGG